MAEPSKREMVLTSKSTERAGQAGYKKCLRKLYSNVLTTLGIVQEAIGVQGVEPT